MQLKLKKIFHYITLTLITVLPFHVLLTVFTKYKLHIPYISFYKEILIIILFIIGLFSIFIFNFKSKSKSKSKINFRFNILDYLIIAYILWLSVITLLNGNIIGLIYGGRLDFLFLFVFLIFRHFRFLLPKKNNFYINYFIITGGIALILGFIVRFGLGEDILVGLGFSPHLSKWDFEGAPPIYHGVQGASVRRFQGIFDGPNQAAFFLIFYITIFVYYFIKSKGIEWLINLLLLIMGGLLFLTYTRSAFVGIFIATLLIGCFSIKNLFTKYKKALLSILLVGIILFSVFFMQYSSRFTSLINRPGSTKGHFERMEVGLTRFSNNIWGQGLATSGPGTRNIYNVNKQTEIYYIPESWYIQQLVEGGFIALLLLLFILFFMTYYLYKYSGVLAWGFVIICSMNIFLHTFESIYINILLFMFMGLFIKSKTYLIK